MSDSERTRYLQKYLEKLERVEDIFRHVAQMPSGVVRNRLKEIRGALQQILTSTTGSFVCGVRQIDLDAVEWMINVETQLKHHFDISTEEAIFKHLRAKEMDRVRDIIIEAMQPANSGTIRKVDSLIVDWNKR